MNCNFDLVGRARRAMAEAGFLVELPAIDPTGPASDAAAEIKDYSELLWSSIDNTESKDLDQVEYAERDGNCIRLMVGIADVDERVKRGSALDQFAANNTTSVYAGVINFPMLPRELSEDKTSLIQDAKRRTIITTMLVQADGTVDNANVEVGWTSNHARLNYDEVGEFLESGKQSAKIAGSAEIREQLKLQYEAALRLTELRKRAGALTFSSLEAQPVKRNGDIVDLKLLPHNLARDVIESFMVAVNIATAGFLKNHGWPILERVVHEPRRWDRVQQLANQYGYRLPVQPDAKALSEFLAKRRAADPDRFGNLSFAILKMLGPGEYVVEYPDGPQQSHFALAVDDYSHSTAPNRRFADLVLQRLLKALIAGKENPYGKVELEAIAARCTDRQHAARKVERLMRKVIAACVISQRIGEQFDAIVTGASFKGTYVRLLGWPAEGRIVKGQTGIDVGDKVKVKLLSADPETGFIDFVRL